MKTKHINYVSQQLKSNRDIAVELKRKQAALRAASGVVLTLSKRLPANVLARASIWVSCELPYGSSPLVKLWVYLDKLSGMKDELLLDTLSQFLDSTTQHTKDYANLLNRDFFFDYPNAAPGIDVKVCVNAYVKADSPTCRKVPVNVKSRIVDESEYVLVCD